MQKITYTKMRSQLSEILDLIRSGETVIITQRGKYDIKINGHIIKHEASVEKENQSISVNQAKSPIFSFENLSPEIQEFLNKFNDSLIVSPDYIQTLEKMNKQLSTVVNLRELKGLREITNKLSENIDSRKQDFNRALSLTQINYASIIKGLEDK